jgi:undecaprenyl-diphosphatase
VLRRGRPDETFAPRRSAAAIALIASLAFALTLSAVVHGGAVLAWDRAVDLSMHAQETPLGDRIWSDVSLLGLPGVWVVDVAVSALLVWLRRWAWLITWVAATAGGGLLERAIKSIVDRPRPPYAMEVLHSYSPSFPSGHAMASAITYLLLAVVVGHIGTLRRAETRALLVIAIVVVAAIGFSRVYLAVHYPTDVLGGYFAGIAWSAGVTACTPNVWTSRHMDQGCPSS